MIFGFSLGDVSVGFELSAGMCNLVYCLYISGLFCFCSGNYMKPICIYFILFYIPDICSVSDLVGFCGLFLL